MDLHEDHGSSSTSTNPTFHVPPPQPVYLPSDRYNTTPHPHVLSALKNVESVNLYNHEADDGESDQDLHPVEEDTQSLNGANINDLSVVDQSPLRFPSIPVFPGNLRVRSESPQYYPTPRFYLPRRGYSEDDPPSPVPESSVDSLARDGPIEVLQPHTVLPPFPIADRHSESIPKLKETYPAWSMNSQIPVSKEDVEDIFIDLARKVGFQRDSMRNMYDFLMYQLDSRASRMTPDQAILSLHADYIGGMQANYRKWYFAAEMDTVFGPPTSATRVSGRPRLGEWQERMTEMSQYERVQQLALWLLCWGEAAQLRFCPECLCFIFKCAEDYYRSPLRPVAVPEGLYLVNVIKPLYLFLRDQSYELVDGRFVLREKGQEQIIGYDDVNELFWSPYGIAKIVFSGHTRLIDVPDSERFLKFGRIAWDRVFMKTYYETRSFGHLLVNFNRIWVLHLSLFWYLTAYNSPEAYTKKGANDLTSAMTWSVTALGGAVATVVMILAALAESSYVPLTSRSLKQLATRLLFLLVVLALTAGPTIYIGLHQNSEMSTSLPRILAIIQLTVSVIATAAFSILPSSYIFGENFFRKSKRRVVSETFIASNSSRNRKSRLGSYLLWLLVFGCTFAESYFFLTLSLRGPIEAMVGMKIHQCNDSTFGSALCSNQAIFALTLMYLVDVVLFFLDTYIWYLFWLTIFHNSWSLAEKATSLKECVRRLPQMISLKLVCNSGKDYQSGDKLSQIWNSVVLSMYRQHLLSIHQVQKLLYQQVAGTDETTKISLLAPDFFASPDSGRDGELFQCRGEAQRRISFFARSLIVVGSALTTVKAMPTFSVFVPHYSEKIISSLRELITEDYQDTRITVLDYLKNIFPLEWSSFVQDSKTLNQASLPLNIAPDSSQFAGEDDRDPNDIAFNYFGFKSTAPEFTLRTRIWASLRMQTLYRTVAGTMNYCNAIKLLHRMETPDTESEQVDAMELELDQMACRKFKFVILMQRYSKFNRTELDNTELLLREFPNLQVAYFEEVQSEGSARIYSALIDGHSPIDSETGKRRPKFMIELPGNPILGDGRADNLNSGLIFYRGEYLQIIDAGQDNYLEECLKIRALLAEFEELTPRADPYGFEAGGGSQIFPVAAVGSREHIFSERMGVLGDLEALREQTMQSTHTRSLSWLGVRMHLGHPDFMNGVFMTTRGGISKAQKSLHLSEGMFAGMNAFHRGGRIKHAEYYQCGKGRDHGFATILNVQVRSAMGMAKQMLSREYYHLGTQLPMDQFLSFYYGYPAFYLNKLFAIVATSLLLIALVFLGSLHAQLSVCDPRSKGEIMAVPGGCIDLAPTLGWAKRCIYTMGVVFMVAYLPSLAQDMIENGFYRAFLRLGKHVLSLSPIFEIFSTQDFSNVILSGFTFGGARYIATGRGFYTARVSFALLYSRFARPSICFGIRCLLLLLYVTLTFWLPHLVYLWILVVALCLSPFIFNPHQFLFQDFIIDYREYLHWMSRGNSRSHNNSWIGYTRLLRSSVTGYKKKRLGHPSERLFGDIRRASRRAVIVSEVAIPVALAIILACAYIFGESFSEEDRVGKSPLVRLIVAALGPIAWNALVLLSLLLVSFFVRFSDIAAVIACSAHLLALGGIIFFFEIFWLATPLSASQAVLGLVTIVHIQRALFNTFTVLLTREYKHDETNRGWWAGSRVGSVRGLGGPFSALIAMAREYPVKIHELSAWSSDILVGHILLFSLAPLVLVPFMDRLQITALLWLRAPLAFRAPIYSLRQQKRRREIVIKYGLLFVISLSLFVALIALPVKFGPVIHANCYICQVI